MSNKKIVKNYNTNTNNNNNNIILLYKNFLLDSKYIAIQ